MIVSCGDSFFYGSDLQDRQSTWPALISKELHHDYQCLAQPGAGNLRILQQIIQSLATHGDNAIYLINWTWTDRFDYVSVLDESWHTVRPSLDDTSHDDLYYRHFHSELADKFRDLIYISQACDLLTGRRYLMTYMDHLLLDQQWHAPDYVRFLQDRVKSRLQTFQGQNFLEWSRSNGFEESVRWHPLESAHRAAANFWLPEVRHL